MNFANPEAFLLFIPLSLAIFYIWKFGPKKRSRLIYPTSHWIDKRPRFSLPSPFKLHFILRSVSLSLLVVALARPQDVLQRERRTVEAIDIIISFDLSKSMDAIDFTPNRRTVAINTILDFIDKRPDDRMGLVLFSGEAYLAVPLTVDHSILKEAINKSSNNLIQDGTAIGQSLAVGVNHLKNSRAKSRIIILVTDGDNNMGSIDPLTATELAVAYNLKIYTIGIGKKGRVQFPITQVDSFGRTFTIYQYLTDAVNDELLQTIANRTNGRFFKADEDGVLEKIFSTINDLEKTKVETATLTRYSEKAWPWILIALLLALAEGIALNTRWRKFP